MPQGQKMTIEIETQQINITLGVVKNYLTTKEMFGIFNLNNDQDMIQAINEAVKTAKAGIKISTAAGYKQGL